jgi:hypothetical protein
MGRLKRKWAKRRARREQIGPGRIVCTVDWGEGEDEI